MSHETHQPIDKKQVISMKSSFWFVLIIAGLFIAAVNFVSAMSHNEEGHGGAHTTEAPAHHDAAPGHDTQEAKDAHGEGH